MSDVIANPQKFAVLYVDDEEQALKYFKRGFEKEYTILSAPRVDQAIAILEKEAASIGVVITDQRMPGRSGVDMLTEVRKRWPSIVRILITAYTDLDSAIAAVNSGAVYKYLTKPADFTLLRQVLNEAMTVYRETIHRDALAETIRQLEIQQAATLAAEVAKELLNQKLIAASREAGRAEVATGILHNVGNVLNSMNVSAAVVNNTLHDSRLDNLLKCLSMLEEHSGDLSQFIASDERGQRLPNYLVKLGPVLRHEHDAICEAMTVLNRSIEHIMQIVRVQQSNAKDVDLAQSLDPVTLMEEAIQINQPAIETAGVRIVREFAALHDVVMDKHRALQILINLISNAAQSVATRASWDSIVERIITLRVVAVEFPSGPRCRFEVCDNGIGIAPENLTKIFTYGFTTKEDGHGFGLHSAANAAREMGGALSVTSEGEGKGATFTLELPMRMEATVNVDARTLSKGAA